MSHKAEITFKIELDDNRIPSKIHWQATDDGNEEHKSHAFLLSIWDPEKTTTYNIDLWTNDMMVHDMDRLFLETFLKMAETYEKATSDANLAEKIRLFARDFGEAILPENKGQ